MSKQIDWMPSADSDSQAPKELVPSAALRANFLAHALLHISCDVSEDSTGTTLEQLKDGMWETLGFHSQHFSMTNSCYSAFDGELSAAYLATQKSQPFEVGHVYW